MREARREEIEEFNNHEAYDKVGLEACYREVGKAPIGTWWVDANKGYRENPEYRRKLVAQKAMLEREIT